MNRGDKIELTSEISLIQLSAMKRRLDKELEILLSKIHKLQNEKKHFEEAKECIESQKRKDDVLLVPLTKTLFVSGTAVSHDTFLVDVGADYYIEKNVQQSLEFFDRRAKAIGDEIEKNIKVAQGKINLRDAIIEALQYRQQASLAIKFVSDSVANEKQ